MRGKAAVGNAEMQSKFPLRQRGERLKTCGVSSVATPEPAREGALSRQYLEKVYRAMLGGRLMETKLSSLYKAGKIVGGVYLGKGQEAVSASLGCALLKGTDVYAPLIRDQAGRTGFGEPLIDCARTYLGSAQGPMKGRDGNIHRGRPQEGYLAMISHLGAAIPVVSGSLLAKRIKGTLHGTVGATCIGDGGTSTGAFHEGLNAAAVERLPLVLVVADNQYAYSTPRNRQFACDDLLKKAKGYGVTGHALDGTDFLESVAGISRAVCLAREGGGPQLVVARLLRLSGHGEHDDGSYVSKSVRESALGRDCLDVAREQLIRSGHFSSEELVAMHNEIRDEVQAAAAQAQREAVPDPRGEGWHALSEESLREGSYE